MHITIKSFLYALIIPFCAVNSTIVIAMQPTNLQENINLFFTKAKEMIKRPLPLKDNLTILISDQNGKVGYGSQEIIEKKLPLIGILAKQSCPLVSVFYNIPLIIKDLEKQELEEKKQLERLAGLCIFSTPQQRINRDKAIKLLNDKHDTVNALIKVLISANEQTLLPVTLFTNPTIIFNKNKLNKELTFIWKDRQTLERKVKTFEHAPTVLFSHIDAQTMDIINSIARQWPNTDTSTLENQSKNKMIAIEQSTKKDLSEKEIIAKEPEQPPFNFDCKEMRAHLLPDILVTTTLNYKHGQNGTPSIKGYLKRKFYEQQNTQNITNAIFSREQNFSKRRKLNPNKTDY